MSDELRPEIQKAEPDPFVVFFELKSKDGGEVVRLCHDSEPDSPLVRFMGEDWKPVALKWSGYERKTGGTQPEPSLVVASPGFPLSSAQIQHRNGLQGWTATLLVTFRKFVGDDSRPPFFPPQSFAVDRLTRTREELHFRLATPLKSAGVRLPRRPMFQGTCSRTYAIWDPERAIQDFKGATCPYNNPNVAEALRGGQQRDSREGYSSGRRSFTRPEMETSDLPGPLYWRAEHTAAYRAALGDRVKDLTDEELLDRIVPGSVDLASYPTPIYQTAEEHEANQWAIVELKFQWITRRWVDHDEFDRNDEPTNDLSKAGCSYTTEGCRKRFGDTDALPIWAFPGLDS